ncbi:DEAD/DEAH box helicase [Methanothermobacter sp.]|uniref:DEAD/DEAH box helicase n=1 Tax=Methanothermobacter sp. TaxID=1884223 RepID=UPI00262D45BF|nr:DEAD/DEAH box helicase [Methanothermobacter sp.]MDI9618246.1 DEAD/DEAH box helicase [Methanothermobacter sp.]
MKFLNPKMRKIITDCYPYIKSLNPAQMSAVEAGYLESDENFIIAIPTASGKTLLGLLAAIQAIMDGGRVIYTVPLLSIQNEKVKEFRELEKHGISVGKDPRTSDLAVMVFESFDSLTRFSWNTLREIDLLIVDEFHMIGEYSRGPVIESAITRAKKLNPSMRIVALSATLSNMNEIGEWLGARIVEHDYRPVPLHREVLDTEMFGARDKNQVVLKILERSISEDSQTLAFVSTRRFTESLASYLADRIKKKIPGDLMERFNEVAERILDVPRASGSPPTSTCLKLADCIRAGVAFHHAGLFNRQREIIEDEFRRGNILMITATPSLMYGVNLPSRTVVIRDYTRWTGQGPQRIPVFDYEQMSGRAGRPLYDDIGYSYLIAKSHEEAMELEEYYVNGEVERTNSRLMENRDALYRQIIAQVASGLASTTEDLLEFFRGTFYGYQISEGPFSSAFGLDSIQYEIETATEFLIKNRIIYPAPSGLSATEFGLLIAKSSYAVETAIKLHQFASEMDELDIYRLIYELTGTPDIPLIPFKGRKSRDPVRERLMEHGIFVMDASNSEATAAALIEWINERTEYEIENAFNVYAASTRRSAYEASRLVKFFKRICEIQGVYGYGGKLDVLAARLYYGVREDIIPLVVGVRGLGRVRARKIVETFGEDLRHVRKDELKRIDGIGEKLAEAIRGYAERSGQP